MNRETINLIGRWTAILLCIGIAAIFASKGQKDIAIAFGVGAGAVAFFGFISEI